MLTLRSIDRTNYEACIALRVNEDQKRFVADNAYSLIQAAYEPRLYPLGLYHDDTMIGFFLYDYDEEIPGWCMSRFMIDQSYQNCGFGGRALRLFLTYFKEQVGNEDLYTSAELDNHVAINLYKKHGFEALAPFSYEHDGVRYDELRMCLRKEAEIK